MSNAQVRAVSTIGTPPLLEDIRAILFGRAAKERGKKPRTSRSTTTSVLTGPPFAKEFHEAIKRGMSIDVLSRLKEQTHLTDEELAQTLGMSRKTLQRRRKEKDQVLTPSEGDRAYRIARVFAFAKALFGSNEAASEWLREPHIGLGRDVPLDLLQTEAGAMEVEDYLGRMAHGVVS